MPGWPNVVSDPIWSSIAIGDLNHDGSSELVFGSNGNKIYAYRANGQEWRDGDSNPSTKGVFKVLGAGFNYSTPALADLDGDGNLDIIYAGGDSKLYAWKMDGTNLPGFPITLSGPFTASPAIGYLDGPGDSQLDIVVPVGSYTFGHPEMDSLYVFRANGARHPGFPVHVSTTGNSKTPSPALADMNSDGFVDVVFASDDGGIYVYDHNGAILPGWSNVRYSPSIGGASESSPVVADINGDGRNDVVMGDENSRLVAIDGMTQTILPGFPITLEAEVKGTPALCDCDGDGMTEIVLSGWDKKLYIWDYDFPFSPGVVPPWPQFHHDAARTGLLTNPVWVGVGDPPAANLPQSIEFSPIYPNPAKARSRFNWAIPADRAGSKMELAVYDLSGRRMQMLDHGVAHAGRYSATWNLRDESGTPASAGVYFIRLTIGSESMTRKLAVLH